MLAVVFGIADKVDRGDAGQGAARSSNDPALRADGDDGDVARRRRLHARQLELGVLGRRGGQRPELVIRRRRRLLGRRRRRWRRRRRRRRLTPPRRRRTTSSERCRALRSVAPPQGTGVSTIFMVFISPRPREGRARRCASPPWRRGWRRETMARHVPQSFQREGAPRAPCRRHSPAAPTAAHFSFVSEVEPGVRIVASEVGGQPLAFTLWSYPRDIAELCGDAAYPGDRRAARHRRRAGARGEPSRRDGRPRAAHAQRGVSGRVLRPASTTPAPARSRRCCAGSCRRSPATASPRSGRPSVVWSASALAVRPWTDACSRPPQVSTAPTRRHRGADSIGAFAPDSAVDAHARHPRKEVAARHGRALHEHAARSPRSSAR